MNSHFTQVLLYWPQVIPVFVKKKNLNVSIWWFQFLSDTCY